MEDISEAREQMRKKSKLEAESILSLAGLLVSRSWELANQYWPDAQAYDCIRMPWWLMMTEIGLIQIGWRKNVIHIEWTACSVRGIVTTDDVTKAENYVHAWSVEKAVEYVRELRRLALAGPSDQETAIKTAVNVERDACAQDLWERVLCTARDLDVVRACKLVIQSRGGPLASHLFDVSEYRRLIKRGSPTASAFRLPASKMPDPVKPEAG